MNIQRLKVYNDGNHFIGVLGMSRYRTGVKAKDKYTSEQKELFKTYYKEAKLSGVPKKKYKEYIAFRSTENDISMWFNDEEVSELLERKQISDHRRKVRYERRIDSNIWNYFVTFTYDDEKESEEGFVKRLRKALSNLSTRNGWRYIGVKERGEKGGRVHFHFIMYVPEGKMVGKLFSSHKYSSKRRRMEYFTDNTYFNERFGQSQWQPITEEDIRNKKVRGYLLKYIKKTDERLIFSRHTPSEFEMDVDLDNDVVMFFRQYAVKCILNSDSLGLYSIRSFLDSDDFFVDTTTFKEIDLDLLVTIG